MSIKEIHYRYWLVISLSILLGFMTVKWHDIPKVAELLSFGLSLSSLALAFVAIFQTASSASSANDLMISLQKSASEIQIASEKTIAFAQQSSTALVKIEGAISNIPPEFSKLHQALEGKFLDLQGSIGVSSTPIGENTKISDNFLDDLPPAGVVVVHLLFKSLQSSSAFDIAKLGLADDMQYWILGVLVGLRSAGKIVTRTTDSSDGKKLIQIEKIENMDATQVENWLKAKSSGIVKFSSHLEGIDKAFSSASEK